MQLSDIQREMDTFVTSSSLNVVHELNGMPIFAKPLIGIAASNDPLFSKLKEDGIIGPGHLLPTEWLTNAKTIVSYFLPFTQVVREANRSAGLPAREWLYGRIEGEELNNSLRNHLVRWFTTAGFAALVPQNDERYKVVNRKSNWSERHVGYIAGLGTFGLSCSFITKAGSAGRLGSVIVNADIPATPRYYQDIYENCTKCGACILRCPPLAISESGKNHAICGEFLDRVLTRFKPRYGCGKCQTAVPCESSIPLKR